jgi:hypothetical protein
MPENDTLYRISLSLAGGLILGLMGLLAGAAWGAATGAGLLPGALVLGAVGFVWGAICFQLTPTGGVIMENKTTVNYAVIATHGWMAFFAIVLALIVWGVRSAVF